MNHLKILAISFFLCPAVYPQSAAVSGKYPPEVTLTLPSGWKIKAKLAQADAERQRGLMYFKSLPENKGMLFVFDTEEARSFWMKNTFIDLDIIYIGADRRIKKIFHRVPRSSRENDYQAASVNGRGMYVLEMAAGFAREHRLWPGQKLSFTLGNESGGRKTKDTSAGGSHEKNDGKR